MICLEKCQLFSDILFGRLERTANNNNNAFGVTNALRPEPIGFEWALNWTEAMKAGHNYRVMA